MELKTSAIAYSRALGYAKPTPDVVSLIDEAVEDLAGLGFIAQPALVVEGRNDQRHAIMDFRYQLVGISALLRSRLS
jgi:hypothetical protein